MSLRLGRVSGLAEPLSWADDGGRVVVTGNYAASSLTDGLVKRDQLLGMVDNWDELIIPVILDGEPRVNGYYRVLAASFTTDRWTRLKGNLYDYRVELERVQGFTQPLCESILSGTLLTNAVGAVTADMQGLHAMPAAGTEYSSPLTGTNGSRSSSDGNIMVRPTTVGNPTLSGTTRSALAPRDFYIGACTIEQGSALQPVVGRTLAQPDVTNWRLSNGLVRVTPSASPGKLDVAHYVAPHYSDFETAGTTQTLFKSIGSDGDNTMNAWSGAGGGLAAHVLTMNANGLLLTAGHLDWWDGEYRARCNWVTGANIGWVVHFTDVNNFIVARMTGTTFDLFKVVGGTFTQVATVGIAAVNATWYWCKVTASGTSYTAQLYSDAGPGAIGASFAGPITATIGEPILQAGRIGFWQGSATGWTAGGNFAGVCIFLGPAPSGYTATVNAGEPAFCWSKAKSYAGTYSASIYNAHSSGQGYWISAATTTIAGISYTLSGQLWGSGAPTNFRLNGNVASPITSPDPAPATSSWQSMTATGIPGAAATFILLAYGAGTYYFDNVQVGTWAAAKTYKGLSTTPFTNWTSLTILRNSVEECTIRLGASVTGASMGQPVTVDLSLRRGDRLVRGYASTMVNSLTWQIARNSVEAATAITIGAVASGAIRATANDADGNRYVILNYQQTGPVNDLTNGAITSGSVFLNFDFAIGLEIGGSAAAAPDDAVSLARQYLGAMAESQHVVPR